MWFAKVWRKGNASSDSLACNTVMGKILNLYLWEIFLQRFNMWVHISWEKILY